MFSTISVGCNACRLACSDPHDPGPSSWVLRPGPFVALLGPQSVCHITDLMAASLLVTHFIPHSLLTGACPASCSSGGGGRGGQGVAVHVPPEPGEPYDPCVILQSEACIRRFHGRPICDKNRVNF
ncbi:hypothetical protein DPEC_G00263840 [Dallia pectoralis]|uniref:Uncharacterized protein n=1 Tax=Dallia pectoralis TaxID=75939 RepID=A0ACC2FS96_DALPE|nr:hypothetical protein DPEC_G00263840 [Dallia pectoralis]